MRTELLVRSCDVVAVSDVPVVLRSPRGIPFAEINSSVMNVTGGEHLSRCRKLQPKDMVLNYVGGEVAGELGARDQLVYEAVCLTPGTDNEFVLVQGKGNLR